MKSKKIILGGKTNFYEAKIKFQFFTNIATLVKFCCRSWKAKITDKIVCMWAYWTDKHQVWSRAQDWFVSFSRSIVLAWEHNCKPHNTIITISYKHYISLSNVSEILNAPRLQSALGLVIRAVWRPHEQFCIKIIFIWQACDIMFLYLL